MILIFSSGAFPLLSKLPFYRLIILKKDLSLSIEWNLDLRKILGVTKIFLKSRFLLISNTRKPLKSITLQNVHLKQYKYPIALTLSNASDYICGYFHIF